jgi:hypothetical protein
MSQSKSRTGNPKKSRAQAGLSSNLDKKLLAYAAAASAAGVSLLALAYPAEGKIVYTTANVEISPRTMVNLDLNHDGINDFKLSNVVATGTTHQSFFSGKLEVLPGNPKNIAWGTGKYASALGPSVSIGPKGKFRQGGTLMVKSFDACSASGFSCVYKASGPWQNATRRYLGLKFVISGKVHYGWARLDVTTTHSGCYALLTGYAYETIANKPILTGATKGLLNETRNTGNNPVASSKNAPAPTLGWLAQGAVGPDTWRKAYASEAVDLRVAGAAR